MSISYVPGALVYHLARNCGLVFIPDLGMRGKIQKVSVLLITL